MLRLLFKLMLLSQRTSDLTDLMYGCSIGELLWHFKCSQVKLENQFSNFYNIPRPMSTLGCYERAHLLCLHHFTRETFDPRPRCVVFLCQRKLFVEHNLMFHLQNLLPSNKFTSCMNHQILNGGVRSLIHPHGRFA